MKKGLISVVLPVYNGEKYLAESIESIINQTYKNWELIIINDCSTDDSLSIAEKYASNDSRIKVYSNEKNLRLPQSLNAGFEKASGEYYTWTSDDNIYKPDAFDVLVNGLESDSEAIMVYTDIDIIDSKGKFLTTKYSKKPYWIVVENRIGACFLYRADAAKAVGEYNPDRFLAEDYDFWIRLFRIGKLKHLSVAPYFYREHPESLSETKKAAVVEITKQLINDNFDFLHKVAVDNNIEFEFFEAMLWRCTDEKERKQYRNRYFKISKRYFLKKLFLKLKRAIRKDSSGIDMSD